MNNEDTPSKKSLIDELHSIKELLEKEDNNSGKQPGQSLTEIPVLSNPIPKIADNAVAEAADKPVIKNPKPEIALDNYLSEEEYNEKNRVSANPADLPEDYSVEFIIQEIIDEMIPDIEARLRSRLMELEPEILNSLMSQSQK